MAKEFEEAKKKVAECTQAIEATAVPDLSHPKAVASFVAEIENYSAILDMGIVVLLLALRATNQFQRLTLILFR